jgi:uncharacterized protein
VRIYELVIEPDREEHIARHNVSVSEAEEVVFGDHVIFRTRNGYFGVIGQTETGRYLTVIIGPRDEGIYGLVTARNADEQERRMYRRRHR